MSPKTTPRPSVKLSDKAAATIKESKVETPAAPEVIAPAGTIDAPAPQVSADLKSVDMPTSKAAQVLAAEVGNDKPATVPATPTAAQLAAAAAQGKIATIWTEFLVAIPGAAAEFAEPNDDQIDTMIEEYMEANPGTRMTKAAFAVKDQIDQARAAHAAAAANSNSVKLEYYRAAQAEIRAFSATIDTLIAAAGGKVAAPRKAAESKADKVVTEGKASTTWVEKAQKLYAWAAKHDIPEIVFVDQTVGGYEGEYHAVKLHTDGRLEKMNYDRDAGTFASTGEFVSTPIYFKAANGERPKYSPDQMFGLFMFGKTLPGLSLSGVKAHLGGYAAILEDASK